MKDAKNTLLTDFLLRRQKGERRYAPFNEKLPPLTWEQIIAIEPRIQALYEEVKAAKKHLGRSTNKRYNAWYMHTSGNHRLSPLVQTERKSRGRKGDFGYKDRLNHLVGHYQDVGIDPRLATMQAHNLCYHKVSDALGNF